MEVITMAKTNQPVHMDICSAPKKDMPMKPADMPKKDMPMKK